MWREIVEENIFEFQLHRLIENGKHLSRAHHRQSKDLCHSPLTIEKYFSLGPLDTPQALNSWLHFNDSVYFCSFLLFCRLRILAFGRSFGRSSTIRFVLAQVLFGKCLLFSPEFYLSLNLMFVQIYCGTRNSYARCSTSTCEAQQRIVYRVCAGILHHSSARCGCCRCYGCSFLPLQRETRGTTTTKSTK